MCWPQLEAVRWDRDGEPLRLVYDTRDHFVLPDPDRTVEALLGLLAGVAAAVELLDGERLLVDGARLDE